MQWKDFNFTDNTVFVSKTTTTIKDKNDNRITYIKNQTKRNVSRTIPLNASALELLEKLKSQQNPTPDTYIVTGTENFLAADVLSQSYKSIATAAGINNPKGIHSLRHTFATQLYAKGIEVKIISVLLGHSSVQTTYNMYIKTDDEQLKNAVNALNNIF